MSRLDREKYSVYNRSVVRLGKEVGMKRLLSYFTRFEWVLLLSSMAVTVASHFLSGSEGLLSLIASLIGAVALMLIAKGNPLGQALCIVFGILYAIISYSYAYYGEMLTYVGMTVPMAVIALIAWIRNPYGDSHAEVRVARLTRWDAILLPSLSVAVTVVFYFVLDAFGTANLLPSTLSVTTSFVAVYLTYRRSPFYALGYAANDIVLIVLWTLAALEDPSYLSVIVCFSMFLVNDLYGFVNWCRMKKKQKERRYP